MLYEKNGHMIDDFGREHGCMIFRNYHPEAMLVRLLMRKDGKTVERSIDYDQLTEENLIRTLTEMYDEMLEKLKGE